MTPFSKAIIIIIGFIFIIIGIYGIWDVMFPLRWRRAKGKILLSRVTSRECKDLDSQIHTMYYLEMEYEYLLDNHRYNNDKISRSLWGIGHIPGNSSSTGIWGPYQILSKRYPEGSSVSVYVNPKDPRDAVLERVPIGPLLVFILCMFLGFGLVVVVALNITIPYFPVIMKKIEFDG